MPLRRQSVLKAAAWGLALCAVTRAASAPGPFFCGNGTVESGEECDDGSQNGTQNSCCESWCALTSKSPDLIVSNIYNVQRFGTLGGMTAYGLGTEACNVGSCWLDWFEENASHPVISQNMFRLKDGRIEHIGQSWVKHGFGALDGDGCGNCISPPTYEHLGVNCTDPYDASTNGLQRVMGPRSAIDPYTGIFPYPDPRIETTGNVLFKRLQVRNTDLDPAMNLGATYLVEIQYVTPGDPGAKNGRDNVSYRKVLVGAAPYNLAFSEQAQRRKAGIRAWKEADPAVVETDIDLDGHFILAAKATPLGGGAYRYEYALQNVTSHRAGRSFTVPLPAGAQVSSVGFRDVDYHSGETMDGTDWAVTVTQNAVTWSTDPFDVNVDANALRWGTLYNFRFDTNVPPGTALVEIGFFRPGTSSSALAASVVPESCAGAIDGTSCEEGDRCTTGDVCQGGVCTGQGPVECTASDACHAAGTCDPGTGLCSNPAVPEQGPCDDGNPCTMTDVCREGVCRGVSYAPPPAEVDDGVRLVQAGGITTVTWNVTPDSTSSAVLRGVVSQLPVGPGGGDEVCLDSAVVGTSLTDAQDPDPQAAFWYLVQGRNSCGSGPYGHQRQSTTCP
jgi:hypothetical protein